MKRACSTLLAACFLFCGATLTAAPSKASPRAKGATRRPVKPATWPKLRRTTTRHYVAPPMEVFGTVQRPNARFVLHTTVSYTDRPLAPHLADRVLDTVSRAPF